MKEIIVKVCGDCPFFDRQYHGDPCECDHDGAPKGPWENCTGPMETPPKWCPIKNGHDNIATKRNANDRIISQIRVKLQLT